MTLISCLCSFVRRGHEVFALQNLRYFTFRGLNLLIYANYTSVSAKCLSSFEACKLCFVKAQVYDLVFANSTFYLSSSKLKILIT